jgi:hypothetical protein
MATELKRFAPQSPSRESGTSHFGHPLHRRVHNSTGEKCVLYSESSPKPSVDDQSLHAHEFAKNDARSLDSARVSC